MNSTSFVYHALPISAVVIFLLTLVWGLLTFIEYKLKQDKD